MSPVEESAKAMATLTQCTVARSQLEEAIGGVVKAEAQLKDNSREVKTRGPVVRLCVHSCPTHREMASFQWLRKTLDWVCVWERNAGSASHDAARLNCPFCHKPSGYHAFILVSQRKPHGLCGLYP